MVLKTTHMQRTVADFADLWSKGRLNLEPAFQRKSVWTVRDRRLLVESLLRGVPLPTVFLYRQVGKGGKPIYDVIDGKQRLETVFLFMGKGPLAASTPPLSVKTALSSEGDVDTWFWSDLPKATKSEILTTALPVVEVEGSLAEIIDLFVRINSTGQQLTGQEKRHARFYTHPVLRRAELAASKHADWLRSHRVLTDAGISRMKHVELMLELLLSIHDGKPINKKSRIDQVIRGGMVDEAAVIAAEKELAKTLGIVDVMLPDLKSTRYRQLADFYTLVLLVSRMRSEGLAVNAHTSQRNSLAGDLLRSFAVGVDKASESNKRLQGVPSGPFSDYLSTVKEGTDRLDVRTRRERILRSVLEGVFEPLDGQRTFNATQRRIIWHSSADKRCSWCGRTIDRWEDFVADHVDSYVKGGATDLHNAALIHKVPCSGQKGAR